MILFITNKEDITTDFVVKRIRESGADYYRFNTEDLFYHVDIPLSRFMQNLSGRYTRWFNWRTQKTGHLFQGRYKAIIVEEDSYLLQLVAYLHLNPVRSGMVQAPEDYRWNSHRAYLGREPIPWLSCEPVLSQLSAKVSAARSQFSEFVAGEIGKGHRKEFHGAGSRDSRIFGEDQFLLDVLSRADQLPVTPTDLPTVVRLVTDFFDCGISELKNTEPGSSSFVGAGDACLGCCRIQ